MHVEDICRAFLAAVEAPAEQIHNEAFNVGRRGENYQIRDVAECVRRTVAGSRIEFAAGAEPDRRCYRVNFDKIGRVLPQFEPRWSVAAGVELLNGGTHPRFAGTAWTLAQLEGHRFMRISSASRRTCARAGSTGRIGGTGKKRAMRSRKYKMRDER